MRRLELPGADGGGPKMAVVVSYIPLLAGEPGRVLSVRDEEFKRLMAEADSCPSGLADACLWMAEGSGVFPVFVMPQAHAIADHLLTWAEDRPGDWFMLCFAQRQGRYVAALFPNLVGSVERFEAAYFANSGEPSRAASYELLFRPITFGFIEPGDFDPATLSSRNLDCIRSRVEGDRRTEDHRAPNGPGSGLLPRMAAGRGPQPPGGEGGLPVASSGTPFKPNPRHHSGDGDRRIPSKDDQR
jgi:hypothetical protein